MTQCSTSLIHTSSLTGLTDFVRREFGPGALQRSYRESGLSMHVEKSAPGFIPETSLVQFMATAARLMEEENAGLRFATSVSFRSYGVWGTYLAQSATLGACLTRLCRIVPLHTPYDGFSVQKDGELVWLRQRFPTSGDAEYRHLAWATVGVFVDLCRQFLGAGWLPLQIDVNLPRPKRRAEIEQVFPVPIRYQAADLGIAVEATALSAPRRHAIDEQVTYGDVLRERGPKRDLSFPTAVEEAVCVQVRAGTISLDDTARMFDMGTRKFQRALDRESLSFRGLVNSVRMARACGLLSETSLPIKAVASQLGYNHVQSFTRAFAATMGASPSAWRDACQTGTLKTR